MFFTGLGLLKHNAKFVITIVTPIILSLIPLFWQNDGGTGKEPYAAYVIILMAIYWMTECLPLPVVSFVPIILFPLFGILSTDRVTTAYFHDSIFFLFGGCMLALSIEYSNLHTRLALKVILLIGAKIPQLLFGIMMTTMFMSMWMNNTSTTAMMVPIVQAIMTEFQKEMERSEKQKECKKLENKNSVDDDVQMEVLRSNESAATLALEDLETDESVTENSMEEQPEDRRKRIKAEVRNLRIMFLLGAAYASNIGGTGIITGSASNVIALDLIRKGAEDPASSEACKKLLRISFLDWMIFNVPPMLLNTILTWMFLLTNFIGFPPSLCFWKSKKNKSIKKPTDESDSVEERVKETIRAKYKALGSLGTHEIGVLILFITIIILWLFKDPKIIRGWDSLPIFRQGENGKNFIKEATPSFLIVFILCIIPSKSIYYKQFWSGGLGRGLKDPLLNWNFIYSRFPWGLFLLLGGGTAMAIGARESGLNKWIGMQLESSSILRECPDLILLLIILVLVAFLTTIASNTATAAIVTPVLLGISYAKDIHPLYMVLAGTTVCSYAFCLPVSTPPNALVYSATNEMKLLNMALPGLVVNIICILTLMVTTTTTSSWFFNFGGYENECARIRLTPIPIPTGEVPVMV